jgi:hypothetical protein
MCGNKALRSSTAPSSKIIGGVYRTVTSLHRQSAPEMPGADSSPSAGSISTLGARPNGITEFVPEPPN